MADQKRRTVSPNPRSLHQKSEVLVDQNPSPVRSITKKVSHKPENPLTDPLLNVLKQNKEKLCQCFQIYEVLYQNSTPQRCLEHNNFLTLYCQNEQKLLCVNCIYGNSSHKLHRVVPIKNSFERIIEDNRAMEKDLQLVIQNLKQAEKVAQEQQKETHTNMQILLDQLDDEYKKLTELITQKYNNYRKILIQLFENASIKNDILISQVNWLKATYIEKDQSLPKSDEQTSVIYAHLTLHLLLQSEKVDPKVLKRPNFQELKGQYAGQFGRIRQMIETGKIKQRSRLF